MSELLDLAIVAARQAGAAILTQASAIGVVERKGDGSPLTRADRAAHEAACASLAASGIPVVSEEGEDLLLSAQEYWLVDPLDGTKDFLAGNGEFTVNIALIRDQAPVLGVVLAPARGELYVGGVGIGCWLEDCDGRHAFTGLPKSTACRMAVSRFHDHPDVELFAQANAIRERVAVGSALKYGYLARGRVDVFPRLVGCSEWDSAAGQAVLEAAGGAVLDWHTGRPLAYGKPGRRNPRLLALRTPYAYDDFVLTHYQTELL